MALIINLRRARKRLERQLEASAAAENRARHGRTAQQRRQDAAEAGRISKLLDAAKREDAGVASGAAPADG